VKALTLHQPWASLIAVGAKRIETRSWSTSYRGPLAIHAAARLPERFHGQRGWVGSGGYISQYNVGKWTDDLRHVEPCRCDHDEEIAGERCMAASDWSWALLEDAGAHGVTLATRLPLGAIVATCDLVDVLPIIDEARGGSIYGASASVPFPFVKVYGDGVLGIIRDAHSLASWIDDERPFGDFTPGRFAWLLDNIQPVDPPIPARGRQGLWTWTPEGARA